MKEEYEFYSTHRFGLRCFSRPSIVNRRSLSSYWFTRAFARFKSLRLILEEVTMQALSPAVIVVVVVVIVLIGSGTLAALLMRGRKSF